MIAEGNSVAFFGKASRGQEFPHGEVGKLNDLGVVDVDKDKQCGARGQHCFCRVFEAPVIAKFRNRSRLKIKCEKFRQFFDSERAGDHGDA